MAGLSSGMRPNDGQEPAVKMMIRIVASASVEQHESFVAQHRVHFSKSNLRWRVPHLVDEFRSPAHNPSFDRSFSSRPLHHILRRQSRLNSTIDPRRGLVQAERVWFDEHRAQHVQVRRAGQVRELERGDPLHRASEVRVYLEAVQVADYQERRVLQVFAIDQELLVGGGAVLVLALVLPGESLNPERWPMQTEPRTFKVAIP